MNKKITVSDEPLTNKSKKEFLDKAFESVGEAMEKAGEFMGDPEDDGAPMLFENVDLKIRMENSSERVQLSVTMVKDGIEEVSVIHELVQKHSDNVLQ